MYQKFDLKRGSTVVDFSANPVNNRKLNHKKHYAQCSMDIKECFTCITSQSLTDNSWNWTWYDRDREMSNESLSYLNLSMKASHVLKPHQHLGDNLWLDSDADKPTIMQTWNQFTSLENCQGRFVFKSRFNFKGLRPTWHWPHPHFVVPARIAWSSMDPPEPPAGFITKPQILHQTQDPEKTRGWS